MQSGPYRQDQPSRDGGADNPTDAHIRFNVAFSQQPRLADYLRERLQSLAGARAALARVSAAGADRPLPH